MSAPLRITIVLGPFIPTPPASAGAIEQLWVDLAEQFAARGHQVTVLSRAVSSLPNVQRRSDVRHVRCPGFDRSGSLVVDLLRDLVYSRRVSTALPKSDVVVTNVFWLPAMLSLRQRKAGRINVHVQRFPKRQMRIYRRADRISTVSSAIADAIVEQCPSLQSKIKVIPNPVNTTVFHPPPHGRDSHQRPQTILYTGRVHPEKGIEPLVDAFCQLCRAYPYLQLRVVGPHGVGQGGGGEGLVNQLKAKAGDAPVTFVGPIFDKRQLAVELQQASYYCYPSLAFYGEASPVAPLEAMATGLAPVVSDLPQFHDYIEHEHNGLVFARGDGEAAERLAACLKRQIDHPDETVAMGERAREVAESLNTEAVAERYLDDFHALVGRQSTEAAS